MKKIGSLKIFGQNVRVKYVKDLIKKDQAQGDYCSSDKIIRIDAALKGNDLIHTLIHEATHALFDRSGIRQAVDIGVEEIIAENISTMLIENFKITS